MSPREMASRAMGVLDLKDKTTGDYAHGKVVPLVVLGIVCMWQSASILMGGPLNTIICVVVVAASHGLPPLMKLIDRININIGQQIVDTNQRIRIDETRREILERRDPNAGIEPSP